MKPVIRSVLIKIFAMQGMVLLALSLTSPANAYCELAGNGHRGSCGSGSSGGGGGGGNGAAAAAAAQIGIFLLQRALSDDNDTSEQPSAPARRSVPSGSSGPSEAEKRATQAERSRKLSALQQKASVDKTLDPWANGGTKTSKKKSDGRAPYADLGCVDIKSVGSGVSWDLTKLTNKCSFPIVVLTCYYDKGQRQKCDDYKGGRWGTSNTISAHSSVAGVSSSQRPGFGVRYFVCNMSGIKNHEKFCLLPKT